MPHQYRFIIGTIEDVGIKFIAVDWVLNGMFFLIYIKLPN